MHSNITLRVDQGMSGDLCISANSADVDMLECWHVNNSRLQIVRDWVFPVQGIYTVQAMFDGLDKDGKELHISTPSSSVIVN